MMMLLLLLVMDAIVDGSDHKIGVPIVAKGLVDGGAVVKQLLTSTIMVIPGNTD